MREMFVGILGHDLRNPLAGILMSAQVVLGRTDDEALSDPLRRVVANGKRMARMVEQLLDLTRLRLGDGIKLAPRPSDLRRLVDDVLAEHGPDPVRFRFEVTGDATGTWDPDRLQQVASNLVGNAARHGDCGSPVVVSIDGTAPERVVLTVHNLGPAIPEELRPVLFAAFRGHDHGRRGGGLGLGLFITDQLVRAHGGTLEFTSHTETGTTFTMRLPRHAGGVAKPRDANGEGERPAAGTSMPQRQTT